MEMDMQITIAGGCGDFGRSCFFVEGGRHAFIVDAGTSTDGLEISQRSRLQEQNTFSSPIRTGIIRGRSDISSLSALRDPCF